jgi:type I site-specific restriction endonuclease
MKVLLVVQLLSSSTNLKYINQQIDKIESGEIGDQNEATSVLQKMIKIDRNVAIAMSVDMMIAGVDTVKLVNTSKLKLRVVFCRRAEF